MLKRPGFKELFRRGPNEPKNGTLIHVCDHSQIMMVSHSFNTRRILK